MKSGVSKMVAMLNDGDSTVGKGLIEGSGLSSPIVVEQLFVGESLLEYKGLEA